MSYLVKEEHYVVCDGTEKLTLRVEELVWGYEPWPGKFRVQIRGSNGRNMASVYGQTSREAAETAAECLLGLAAQCVPPADQLPPEKQRTD